MLKHDDRQAARADSGSNAVFLAALPGEVDQAHVVAEQLHVGDSIGINVGKRHPLYIGTNAGGASLCLVPEQRYSPCGANRVQKHWNCDVPFGTKSRYFSTGVTESSRRKELLYGSLGCSTSAILWNKIVPLMIGSERQSAGRQQLGLAGPPLN